MAVLGEFSFSATCMVLFMAMLGCNRVSPAVVPPDIECAALYSELALRSFSPGDERINIDTALPKSTNDVFGVFFDAGTLVESQHATLINEMVNVYVLGVEKCQVSSGFWKTLDMSRIEYLYAGESNLSDSDCEYIARGKALLYVSLYETPVSAKGQAIIRAGVPEVSIGDWYY